jgi:hypothetical protein
MEIPSPDRRFDSKLLTKATVRAADFLGIHQRELATILDWSEASVSRLRGQTVALEPDSRKGEIALLLLRIYRSLDALLGGKEDDIRKWFSSYNTALGGVPRDLVKSLQGLFHVLTYLDAMRGKL